MNDWLKFFLVRLPLAILGIGVVVELLAFALSGIPLHRHNVDDLATAVESDRVPYSVVLLGDSVTHMVSNKYRVGDPGVVADLTTHALAGLPSSMFLLKRYLESGHRPKLVVLAPSVHTLTEPMLKDQFDYYLTTVFTRPWEKEFLIRNYPSYVDYSWKPAAYSMTTRIGEPIFSLLRHPGTNIWITPELASEHPVLDQYPPADVDPAMIQKRIDNSSEIRPEGLAIVDELARLSQQYKFDLKIMWPPMYGPIHEGVVASGHLAALEKQITSIAQKEGVSVTFFDTNSLHVYPSFDPDLIHIKGAGWEQTYSNDMSNFVKSQIHP